MIRLLDGMPPGVLGLEAVDDVEEDDYTDVLVPAVEAAIAEHGKVRLVYTHPSVPSPFLLNISTAELGHGDDSNRRA
jgi:hypothetical protein